MISFICSFSFVAADSLTCRPSVQIYPIILTIVIFVTVISVLKSYINNNKIIIYMYMYIHGT